LCEPSLATCDNGQLHEVLACVSPHLDPNCDEDAFFGCLDTVGCVDN
jgi:hypothetical protein